MDPQTVDSAKTSSVLHSPELDVFYNLNHLVDRLSLLYSHKHTQPGYKVSHRPQRVRAVVAAPLIQQEPFTRLANSGEAFCRQSFSLLYKRN